MEKKHKKEKKEKKKQRTEDKRKAKAEGRKEGKREGRKEEAKLKNKKTEERTEEEKKHPKGKSGRMVVEDNARKDVLNIKGEAARMTAVPRPAPRSTHLEVMDDVPSPCGSASGNSCKSGSSNSSTSSNSGSSNSSSERQESAQKRPVHHKRALEAKKTEAPEKRKEKAKSHFLVEAHGRPPSKLTTGQTRQEKFTRSPQHVQSVEIFKSFFSKELGYSLRTFVHHCKNCYGQLKSATALLLKVCVCTMLGVLCMEALPVSPGSIGRVPREEFAAHVVSASVPGDFRVVQRVFRVLQCVRIPGLPPQC